MKDAYYTVEATFIMTIVIWVLMALFYSGMYLHDRMIVESEMNRQLAGHFQNGEGEVTDEFRRRAEENLESRLFLMRVHRVQIEKGLASADMTLRYELPISLKKLKHIFTGGESETSLSVTRELVRPAKYKWDYDMMKESGNTDS